MDSALKTSFKKPLYKYVAPSPPNNLIDSTTFVLDFAGRKFLHIGFEPVDKFNVVIHIITPSRHVCLSPEFLKRIYSIMGDILSVVLDTPNKSVEKSFHSDESVKLLKMVYRGENMLVIESQTEEGCRVLLGRKDLLMLVDLEHVIYDSITRKTTVTRPLLLKQFGRVATILVERNIKIFLEMKQHELIPYIKRVPEEEFAFVSASEPNFIHQFKMYAIEKLALHLFNMKELDTTECDGPTTYSAMSPISSPSPSSYVGNFYQQDEDSTGVMTVEENKEPMLFNLSPPSPPPSPLFHSKDITSTSSEYPVPPKRRRQLSDYFSNFM